MFCRHCGQENANNAVRCIRCGEAMTPEIASPRPTAGDQQSPPQLASSVSASAADSVGNNLVWAILATLFCCLPTGIVAIVYAAQVNTKLSHGDLVGARESARSAAVWSWVSFGLGLFVSISYFALVFLSIAAEHS